MNLDISSIIPDNVRINQLKTEEDYLSHKELLEAIDIVGKYSKEQCDILKNEADSARKEARKANIKANISLVIGLTGVIATIVSVILQAL